eukprot:155141_1
MTSDLRERLLSSSKLTSNRNEYQGIQTSYRLHQNVDSESSDDSSLSYHQNTLKVIPEYKVNLTTHINTNVIPALRHKKSRHKPSSNKSSDSTISNALMDTLSDYQTSAIALLYIGFTILTMILIVIGYVLHIDIAWKYGTFLCLVTNIFAIIHSVYSVDMTSKLSHLNAATHNCAVNIKKFAKTLNLHESYLYSTKHILDFLDHHISKITHEHP